MKNNYLKYESRYTISALRMRLYFALYLRKSCNFTNSSIVWNSLVRASFSKLYFNFSNSTIYVSETKNP